MSARDIILAASEAGITLFLKDGQLAIRAPNGAVSKQLRSSIRRHKAEIVQMLSGQADSASNPVRFERLNRPSAGVPLSYGQERLWLLDRINSGSVEYNSPLVLELFGEPNIDALTLAFQCIVERHEILRTVYSTEHNGQPIQIAQEPGCFSIRTHDISKLDVNAKASQLQQLECEEAAKPFDLSRDLMIRACLIKVDDGHFELMVTLHHIASDGWTMGLLTRELSRLYTSYIEKRPPLLPELGIQYADYALWQRERLVGSVLEESLALWCRKLKGIPETHHLPTDRSYPPEAVRPGNSVFHSIDPDLTQRLKRFCGARGVTVFTVLHAVFAVLLHRLSGEIDVVMGIPVANREAREIENLVGFFVNMMVLRSEFRTQPTFDEVILQSKDWILTAQKSQQLPFEKLVEELRPERKVGQSPLFQIALSFQDYDDSELVLPGIKLQVKHRPAVASKFDLHLDVMRQDDGFVLNWTYSSALFDRESIERMATYFDTLLREGIDAPSSKVDCLRLLTADKAQALLSAWSQDEQFAIDACIHERFEREVARDATAPALSFGDETLSYGELNARANRLAHYLIERGVGPDVLVGLSVERSVDLVVGILGILKAGGAYVPLDPGYPEARLRYMMADSGVELVLTQRSVLDRLPEMEAQAVVLDEAEAFAGYAESNPQVAELEPGHLSYVIYTSGSTGEPKGVLVEHRQVVRLFEATRGQFGFGRDDVWTLFHSYAFDFSVWELWGALAHGGRLVLVSQGDAWSPESFYSLLEREGVTVLNQTPTAFAQLSAVDARVGGELALRVVIFGGEALKLSELADWVGRHGDDSPQLVNMYGITETTVHVTYRRLLARDIESGRGSVIGRALDDLRLYVLDTHGAVVPMGVAGELYVGGAGLARGYLGRAQLTAERFVSDPYRAGEKLYRTGDVARYLPSGEFEYLGRGDAQVKVRGFRIEPGEIEHCLSALSGVQGSVVEVRDGGQGDKRLVAYVGVGELAADESGRSERIAGYREALSGQLPGYMVPSAYVELEALPLTVNGKVDRQSLPEPDESSVQQVVYEAPRDDLEEALCTTWSEVLGLERVGIRDNFFNIGGDSILSIRIVSLLEHRGVRVSVRELFSHQTVAGLATHLRARGEQSEGPVEVEAYALLSADERERVGTGYVDVYPLSALQAGMVFHTQLEGFGGVYHDVMADHIKCAWDEDYFVRALGECMMHHPILHTGFDLSGERALQHVHDEYEPPLEVVDLRSLGEDEQEAHIEQWIETRKRHVFDWSRGPLFQVNIFLRTEESFEFVLAFHHAILDGWSRAAFTTELYRRYERLLSGAGSEPVEVDWTYRQFIGLEQAALSDPQAKAYFAGMLAGAPSQQLPRRDEAERTGAVRRQQPVMALSAHSAALFELARTFGVPVQTLLLAVHFKVLSAVSGESVALSTITHNGRPERAGAEQSLGLYLNSVPLALAPGQGSWVELIEQVAEANTRSMAHRLYPLSAIQKDVDRTFSEVTFNYTHFHVFETFLSNQGSRTEHLGSEAFEQTNFDFHVDVSRGLGTDELYLVLNYDADVYEPVWIERIAGYYLEAVEKMLADPQARHDDASLLSVEEHRHLGQLGTGVEGHLPCADAVGLLGRGFALDRAAPAVSCGEVSLSYGELDVRANRLAQSLVESGLGSGSRVGIYVGRSVEQLIAVLGVLRSGASYVPLDMDSPADRIERMLVDADVELVLLHGVSLERLPLSGVDVLLMDGAGSDSDWLSEFGSEAPALSLSAASEAYVLYTSGSTGEPKGVRVSHGGLANYLWHASQAYFDDSIVGGVVSTPLCFDATLTTLLSPLCVGRRVALIDEEQGWLERLGQWLFESREGWLFKLTPAHLDALSAVVRGGRPNAVRHRVVVGGEQFMVAQLLNYKRGLLPQTRFVNEYGPTETVVGCSVYEVDEVESWLAERSVVPIGRPIANTRLRVQGVSGELVPAGSVGELLIGGSGVALGYVNRLDQTASRFVEEDGERWYYSGDRVRWLEGGALEYVGRRDDQVKVRGYRVELGEVESALRGCGGVEEAVVVEREGRLAAYVVGEVDAEGCRRALGERLPDYMLPTVYVELDELPLTANGKVDRGALPALDGESVMRSEYEAPRNALEAKLCAVWADVLGLERVGIRDNFFSIGGDSILSIRVVALLKAEGIALGVQDVFRHQNIAELAVQVEAGEVSTSSEEDVKPFSLLDEHEQLEFAGLRGQPAYMDEDLIEEEL